MTQMKKKPCNDNNYCEVVTSISENMYVRYLKRQTLYSGIKCYCLSSVADLELGRIDFCMLDLIH